jgi:hypothetical protein
MRPHDALFSKKFDGSALGVHEIELARFPVFSNSKVSLKPDLREDH